MPLPLLLYDDVPVWINVSYCIKHLWSTIRKTLMTLRPCLARHAACIFVALRCNKAWYSRRAANSFRDRRCRNAHCTLSAESFSSMSWRNSAWRWAAASWRALRPRISAYRDMIHDVSIMVGNIVYEPVIESPMLLPWHLELSSWPWPGGNFAGR